MTEDTEWKSKIHQTVKYYYDQGYKTLDELLPFCEGAPPKEVAEELEKLKDSTLSLRSLEYRNKFYFNIPAANPLNFQWWYTLSSQEKFIGKILKTKPKAKCLCIGTPTIAAALTSNNIEVCLLDIDKDIVELFKKSFPSESDSRTYDVFSPLCDENLKKYDITIIDPPWYKEYFEAFLTRAIQCTIDGGIIYCSIPQELTRPNILDERRDYISSLTEFGHEVLCIEKSELDYIIPDFEHASFKENSLEVSSHPWRHSDLMTIVVNGKGVFSLEKNNNPEIISYSRKGMSSLFRVFIKNYSIQTGVGLKPVPDFKKTISRRIKTADVNIWTSKKDGFQSEDIDLTNKILTCWAEGKGKIETISELNHDKSPHERDKINNLIDDHDNKILLWKQHSSSNARRSEKDIKAHNEKSHSQWAAEPSIREHGGASDGFRIEFQRDRDRVIWSNGFRKLADKTQLFPLETDENLRQRLAHSIEVMQLATTISNSFGLDKDLVEAGALAHDIGHTPFGHAGENAIDRLLQSLGVDSGFNHYEHGVDVVRYLEGAYQNNTYISHSGLNLTPEVCDCILKHTYCHTGGHGSHEEIWNKSKHQDFIKFSGFSHLEGQAVRAADKISYLLSDIEDGIRLGAITHHDLMTCRLFHRSPIDFRMKKDDILYAKFIEQRGSIIKLLMEDLIIESSKRIGSLSSINEVRNASDYCIFHSAELVYDMNEIWTKIQVQKLHNDPRVITANLKASKIVTELVILFTLFPQYIDLRFQSEHQHLKPGPYMKYYYDKTKLISIPESHVTFLPLNFMIEFNFEKLRKVDIYNLIIAKDYVASLSDNRCRKLHKELLMN